MPVYILVHGGRQTGKVWDKVAPLLEEKGCRVFCPTLSDPEERTLQDHIDEVCHLIKEENLNHVILVGHSYAGLVITGVANKMPEKLSYLVYLDAAIPENGKSLFDLINATGFDAQDFYHVEPLSRFTTPIYFEALRIKRIPKIYILCKQSEFINVTKEMAQKVLDSPKDENWTLLEMNSSHSPMEEHPQELTDLLLKIKA
ncbi:MAG: alpha/beta hydrolase fold protein [uncultured bacterium]|nr:MAG: alpha/beta hydrolase fold protein [uncultured bacterium]OFW68159.1 MAG: hypothetical protein A2X70_05620 [Alphaproteobacteria bacterium GWC2_42_16]OFW73552.1 MAG: hypothetical protein A2Z80_06920 [Alphaproteobacteria bacterium GWA2_41_27]OFW82401.1 MAG: hypothetical protein A3E50_04320 [Alphaproteobacteria bacterium RIFCSPHIGHO2_12_FULL_42_100]OFW86226.1 MAG: hypothetical protein A2W06_01250 [Alphaproteobacteria bacterium RBG_16_42_14]OFW91785.1 MAG: hypothetical protein A3C41_01290 [A